MDGPGVKTANEFVVVVQTGKCAVLNIPGFTFPVRQFLLEDVFELLQCVLTFCVKCSLMTFTNYSSAKVGERHIVIISSVYVSVCLSSSISLELLH